ncbi:MAG: nitronate monooxygenase [Actinobacteria bacterium]|nr:nitronate monooxygenase [Actinomycetota bacterium]MBO0836310.1 nitronate monooxygenase [Actinomycetota bacterium]
MFTEICQTLGIDVPIFAFSHCRDVVAAVTNAGGFGVLGATAHSPAGLEIDLAWIDEQVGGKPYGVDLLLPARFADTSGSSSLDGGGTEPIPAGHREFVADVLDRYDVPPLPEHLTGRRGTLNVSAEAAGTLLDVAFRHPIKLVASALGPPPAELTEQAHARGVIVAALVGTVEHARRQQAAGVDLIVAQGTEAGGHTGTVATMVLVPEVVRAVSPTPVLAAGGIVTGSQMAAAIALGAQGVWCGSVWLTTQEAETDPAVQQKMLAACSSDTVRSRSLTGKPARMLRSAWTDEWESSAAPEPLQMPLQTMLTASAQQRITRSSAHPDSGAQQLATYFVGQGVGLLDRIRPAKEVVADMVTEYLEVAGRFAAQLSD